MEPRVSASGSGGREASRAGSRTLSGGDDDDDDVKLRVQVDNSDNESVGEKMEGDTETRCDKETPEESEEDEDEKVNTAHLSEW